jgi:exonuclease SbcC
VRDHDTLLAAAQAWQNALERSDEISLRVTSATEVGRVAAAEAGFDSLDDAAAAAMAPADLDRLRDRLHDHDRARSSAVAVLEDPDVVAAEAAAAPDLDAVVSAAQQARSALLMAQSAQTEVSAARRSFTKVRSSLIAGLDAAGPALTHHHRIKELADTFTGGGLNNTLRMRLTSFVLAARLDTVARLANERLRIMGDGRYTLEHSDRLAARGARSGLGLRVLDQWTGVSRETSTLSGGEAFMASLALALGLADAVREESGGFDLGTLFVDEGFGTLDDESLEQVISVLDSLREGGRAVGVVSHVGELRSRITSQLVVRKTASGSTVAISTPGAESAA